MSSYADRLRALRDQLKHDRLDGFVVPLTDEHMSEYVGGYAQRLAWLTGFQGSAGAAAVLPEAAAIFTDGRYTLQVRQQVDGDHWAYVGVPQTSIAGWLAEHAPQGARIGYDPWLHTRAWVNEASRALAERGAVLVPVDTNPVDAIWPDRPAPSGATLSVQDDARAGQSSAEKQTKLMKEALSSKTLNEFTEVQNKIAQHNFDDFMSGATKISEQCVRVLTACSEPVNSQMSKVVKKATSSIAA